MNRYKVRTTSGLYKNVDADLFKMVFDGTTGMDAYFYVNKEHHVAGYPDGVVYEEILVSFARLPTFVGIEDALDEHLDDVVDSRL